MNPMLDNLRDRASSALNQLIAKHCSYVGSSLGPGLVEKLSDLADDYVTAQADYTNALYDWERLDD